MRRVLILLCLILLFAVPAAAADTEYGTGYIDPGFEFPTSYGFADEPVSNYAASLPTAYDLRDENRVSPVRDQGQHGTCWAFASIASIESNLLTQGYTDVDLSERHLVYFTHNHQDIADLNNPYPGLEGIAGDYLYPSKDYLKSGGNEIMAAMTLASGLGAVTESNAVYFPRADMSDLPADLAMNANAFQIQNTYWVSKENPELIKQYIMEKGAGTVSYLMDQYNSAYCTVLSDDTCAYYVFDETGTDHEVSLIGWDDTFSASNFATTPPGDGAWLIQNSWGYSQYMYLWISYYDTSLQDFGFFEAGPASKTTSIYQYDGTASPVDWTYSTLDSLGIANVYTASSSETLDAVSFFIGDADVTYTVKIYKGGKAGNPESGSCVLTQTGFRKTAGYVYVPLETTVPLSNGERFSVVITINPAGTGVSYFKDTDYSASWYSTSTTAESGQSYLSTGGSWEDVSSDGHTNIRIKAFTTGSSAASVPQYLGSGTEANPYRITTAEQLSNIRYNLDAHYRLEKDIDLSGYAFEPIGNIFYSCFSGSLDGNGHTISHLTINEPDAVGLGLFGYIKGGTVTDLTLSDVSITGDYALGGLAGLIDSGSVIQNCVIEDGTISGTEGCGGLAGFIENGNTIDSCSTEVIVSSVNNISGGLAGWVENGNIIKDCTAVAEVSVGMCAAGGLIGTLYCDNAVATTENIIQNCAVVSVVDGGWSLGGFVGEVCGEQTITQSSAVSAVTGWDSMAGGFVGWAYDDYLSGASISDSYAYAVVDVPYGSGGFAGEFSKGVITHVYSAGFVNGTQYVGGLVGWIDDYARLTNSFALPYAVSGTADTNRVLGYEDYANIWECYALEEMLNPAGSFTSTEYSLAGSPVTAEAVWNSQTEFCSIGFDFSTVWKMNTTNKDYLLPELINTPVIQPDVRDASYLRPVVIPEDATGTELTNTTATFNAKTAASVSYMVQIEDAASYSAYAPIITRGVNSLLLNETVTVTAHYGWFEETVPAVQNADGTYSIPGDVSDAYYLTFTFQGRMMGDVTNDGKPDTLDAARVLQASVNLYEFSDADTFYGDVSGDGFANTLDAARILQYSVNLVDENYMTKA